MCLVVSDFRHKSDFINFHSDLIQKLNKRNTSDGKILKLQGVKILIQNHKSLLPYGYLMLMWKTSPSIYYNLPQRGKIDNEI